jgi:transcriptional regulator with XRE-family HTH domain
VYSGLGNNTIHGRRLFLMGYKIKELREIRNMTQEELAEKSGISRATISMLENNTTKEVLTSTLRALASALDTTVNDLFFADSGK